MKHKDENWLKREYVEKQRSMTQIAQELGVSAMTVRKYVIKFGFDIRDKSIQRSISINQQKEEKGVKSTTYSSAPKNPYLADKQWLEDHYVHQAMSLRGIAEKIGIKGGRRTIKRALLYHNIPTRDLKEARKNRTDKGPEFRGPKNAPINDVSSLVDMYLSGDSIDTIKRKLNVAGNSIKRRLQHAGVKIRDPWEHRVGSQHKNETKKKMSITAVDQILNGTRNSYSNSIKSIYVAPDGKILRTRSMYEKRYAIYLKQQGIKFEYESKSFNLGDGKLYVPDFYLPETDEYIEIKGYLSESQAIKYEKFKALHPDIKWKILFKEDLIDLGININPLPTVYMLIGAPAAGKSWVANQLLDKFDYVSYDGNRKKDHLDLLRAKSDKPKLYDPTFKISTVIRRYSEEFNFIVIAIQEEEEILRARIANRGGKWTDTVMKRNTQIKKRYEKYSEGGFIGTSDEVLAYFKSLPEMV